jgi:hypothetical protein
LGTPRAQLEKLARRQDAVVHAVPVLAEEQVPRHLAAQQDLVFPHLALEMRVPRLPHDGLPAVCADVVHEHLGALHVEHHLGARMTAQEVAGQERQDQIGLVPAPALVHHAHAVGVAVVGNADVRADLLHLRDEVTHVLFHLGIGQVIRKRSVGLAEELDDLAPEPPEQLGGEHAGDAVAGIDHDLQPSRERDHAGDGAKVLLTRVSRRAPSLAACEVRGADGAEQALDLVLGEGSGPRVHHLHAVVRDRIVAACHGGAAVELPVCDGEIEQRGVIGADVDHVHAGRAHAAPKGLLERRRRDPIVHAERDLPAALPAHERAVGAADLLEHVERDVDVNLSAHVVRSEDERVDLHGRCLRQQAPTPLRSPRPRSSSRAARGR